MSLLIISNTGSSCSSSSKSSRILDRIRNLTTSTNSFNRPTLSQYHSNDCSNLRALILHNVTSQDSLRQDDQQGHEDEHSSHGPDVHCCQEIDPDSIFIPEPKAHSKKNLSSGRRFFTQTLKLTLCVVILLTILPCGQGAPVPEPDSLVYQESLARSKRFIAPLIIGAICGWLSGPAFVPSTFSPSSFNRTSNRTTRDADEDHFQPKAKSFSLLGFVWNLLSGSFVARSVLGVFQPKAVPQTPLEAAPHREKRSLAIFDLVSGALTHWILPEGQQDFAGLHSVVHSTHPSFPQCGVNQGGYSTQA